MSNKTLIIIVVGGLGAVVLLGLSMEYVVKSNPGLQESIKFKQAFARDFASRGIQEVALRKLKRTNGYQLLLTATTPDDEIGRKRLDEDVADYFVRTHSDKRAHLLKVSYHAPRSWGCSAALAEPHRVEEISLSPIRRHITRVEKQTTLAAQLEQFGCKVLSWKFESTAMELRVKVPSADPGEVTNLARRIEREARARLRGLYSTLRLLLLGEPTARKDEKGKPVVEENILFEGTFDRRGSRRKPSDRRKPRTRSGEGSRARTRR